MSNIPIGATIKTTRKVVPTGTAERVMAPDVNNLKRSSAAGVEIMASPLNTVAVFVGGVIAYNPSTGAAEALLTTNSRWLMPGANVTFPVDDPSKLYVISGTAAQEVAVTWE